MALDVDGCLRRFLLDVLPPGFVRIRHFGLLANAQRRTLIARAQDLLGTPTPARSARRAPHPAETDRHAPAPALQSP